MIQKTLVNKTLESVFQVDLQIKNLTVMILAYNEAVRIKNVIDSVSAWGNQIIVIDKDSTDDTVAIARSSSPNVEVIKVPFSERGNDDFRIYLPHAKHDWVFLLVASEYVEGGLRNLLTEYFEQNGYDKHDVLMIPRKFVAFGVHLDSSPWSYLYFPFMFNKNRVNVTNILHEHFSVSDESKRFYLPRVDGAMVLHNTHLSAKNFLTSMAGYFEEEVRMREPNSIDSSYLNNIYDQYLTYEAKLRTTDDLSSIMHYAAWTIYWHGVLLYACEKKLISNSETFDMNATFKFSSETITSLSFHQRKLEGFKGLHRGILRSLKNRIRLIYRNCLHKNSVLRRIVNFVK